MTDRVRIAVVAAMLLCNLCTAPAVYAEVVPAAGSIDARIRTVAYDERQVYRLHGFAGYQIDLEFEPGETFIGMGAGDLEGLAYSGQDNHLFLKPKAARVATNLTVLTNRRHYQFEYTSLAQHPSARDAAVIFALRFTYPPAPQVLERDFGKAAAENVRNTDYWYCGDPTIRPVLAEDDGVHTRLRFAVNAELPAIFVGNDDSGEALVNTSMEGGDVVIHRVARRFVLRRGPLVGCVVNKGFTGGGVRLESGTVTPRVERRVQGSIP